MTGWFAALAVVYSILLAIATLRARRDTHSSDDYVMAGSRVGVVLGFLSFSATLFSTFTLMGMPDFFRTHGVGAWVFLGVTDAALAFVLLWFGSRLRRSAAARGFAGVAGMINRRTGGVVAGRLYWLALFVFMIPYISIQIRGMGIFLEAMFPGALPVWGWATAIVIGLLIYSEIGGMKAILYSDALQGVLLLGVTWLIAANCVEHFGGLDDLLARVGETDEALLSTPGPEGLFSTQFLIASFLSMALLPITQPQLTTRLVIMRDTESMHRMAVAVGVFALLVILPTLPIGLYGAVLHPEAEPAEFLVSVLVHDQAAALAAAVAIGLIAAAMSTADSQLFALGTELRSLLSGTDRSVMLRTRLAIVALALASLAFSLVSSDQLVLLARVSFTGTSLLAPLVLSSVLSRRGPRPVLVLTTAASFLAYLSSLLGIAPAQIGGLRMELVLLALLAATALLGDWLPLDRSGSRGGARASGTRRSQ